jgi:hypothetical protein
MRRSRIVATLVGLLAIGASTLPAAWAGPAQVAETPAGWQVTWNGSPVLTYRSSADLPKPFVHPLFTPAGNLVTLASPPDHIHHRGLMFAWGNVIPAGSPEGYHLVFWGEEGDASGLGHIVAAPGTKPEVEVDGGAVSIDTRNEWRRNSDNLLVLRERSEIRVFGPYQGRAYLLSWITEQTPLMDIAIGPTPGRDVSYYGLGLRTPHDMDRGDAINSNGKLGINACYGDTADWCAYGSDVAPARGFAMFDHPGNPRHPTGWFVMNDFGYMTASLPAREPFSLKAGETLRLEYGVLAFDGNLDAQFIQGAYDWWKVLTAEAP